MPHAALPMAHAQDLANEPVKQLDHDCRWAVVGSPSRDYLGALSRETHMRRVQFEVLRHRVAERGYPIEKLVMLTPLD